MIELMLSLLRVLGTLVLGVVLLTGIIDLIHWRWHAFWPGFGYLVLCLVLVAVSAGGLYSIWA